MQLFPLPFYLKRIHQSINELVIKFDSKVNGFVSFSPGLMWMGHKLQFPQVAYLHALDECIGMHCCHVASLCTFVHPQSTGNCPMLVKVIPLKTPYRLWMTIAGTNFDL